MTNLGPVTEDSVRNYDKDPYKGERSNNDGTQDVGGNFLDMLPLLLLLQVKTPFLQVSFFF